MEDFYMNIVINFLIQSLDIVTNNLVYQISVPIAYIYLTLFDIVCYIVKMHSKKVIPNNLYIYNIYNCFRI